MKKRNLATAFAVLTIAGAVVPMTANAEVITEFSIPDSYNTGFFNTTKLGDVAPFNISPVTEEIRIAWNSRGDLGWEEKYNISRNASESDYDYYNRIRDFVAANWTITTEVPTTVAQAAKMAEAHRVDNRDFYIALETLLRYKSDLRYEIAYLDYSYAYLAKTVAPTEIVGSGWSNLRTTERLNEFGQTQTLRGCVVHNCYDLGTGETSHHWYEKNVFGVIELDGKMYAMKITADSATCGKLVPYEDLGYTGCDYSYGWDEAAPAKRYMGGYIVYLDKKYSKAVYTHVYNMDGSYRSDRDRKKAEQALVDGVILYYCENGVIKPMTKALHDTLPNNDSHYYANNSIPAGWKLFAD